MRARSIRRDLDEIWSRFEQDLKRRLHLMIGTQVISYYLSEKRVT